MNRFYFAVLIIVLNSRFGQASNYSKPSPEISKIVEAPSMPSPILSPTKDNVLLASKEEYPSIKRVAEPYLKLAGVRIEPKNHSQHDTRGGYGIPSCFKKLSLVKVSDGSEKQIDISKLECADRPYWSADGKSFFIKNKAKDSVELWIGTISATHIYKIPNVKLNPMLGAEAQWMPNQQQLLVKLVPSHLGAMPEVKQNDPEPIIQESLSGKGNFSTYEKRDVLTNTNDEKLFDYFGTSQLALVDIKSKKVTNIGKPELFQFLSVSPDGFNILVSKIQRPYSYSLTYYRFPKKIEILNISNLKKISSFLIADLPLADRVPIHGEPLGPRDFYWNPHQPATLFWAEALDGGDWNNAVPARDKIMMIKAPFKNSATEAFKTTQRIDNITWLENKNSAFVTEYDDNKHWRQTYLLNFDNFNEPKKIIWDMSSDEEYLNPGDPVLQKLSSGHSVIKTLNDFIFLDGNGSSPDGDRPFLDKLNLTTLKTERLFRSTNTSYEMFFNFIGKDETNFLTWSQSVEEVPNLFKNKITNQIPAAPGEAIYTFAKEKLTNIQDPTPEVRAIKKRLVKYKRNDGIDLSFVLYTPPGYVEGTQIPVIVNASYRRPWSQVKIFPWIFLRVGSDLELTSSYSRAG